jgi:hypothetical protein
MTDNWMVNKKEQMCAASSGMTMADYWAGKRAAGSDGKKVSWMAARMEFWSAV